MWLFNLFKTKKRKERDKIEKMLREGKIILPTDSRDYENLGEFKEKTKDNTEVINQLNGLGF